MIDCGYTSDRLYYMQRMPEHLTEFYITDNYGNLIIAPFISDWWDEE